MSKRQLSALIALAVMAVTPLSGSVAQTALPPVPPARPVPDSVVKQAEQHSEGTFGGLRRAGIGGQIQDAWDDVENEAGVFDYRLCQDCTYKIRLREHMVTVLELPEGEVIDRADVGDSGSFTVLVRGDRRLAVKPQGYGVDSNVMVYGRSGMVYPVYLRAESFNSGNVPDLFVRIVGEVPVTGIAGIDGPDNDRGDDGGSVALGTEPLVVEADTVTALDPVAGSAGKDTDFDADALRGWGDYTLWAGGDDGDSLRPETVFRDDRFTYIKFGERWKDVELPTAYVVVDGIDELVNTRVQGHTYIVESIRPLITLKSGLSYLCIRYEGSA